MRIQIRRTGFLADLYSHPKRDRKQEHGCRAGWHSFDTLAPIPCFVNAAKTFLRKAIKGQRTPTKITLDGYAASHRAVADLKENGELPTRVVVRGESNNGSIRCWD